MSDLTRQATEEFVQRYWSNDDDDPKHERLRRAFSTAIAHGFWGPGARLPTEVELTETIPCSLGTVQRALRQLTSDGLIKRRRGSGSIVTDSRIGIDRPWHMRFFDDKRDRERPLAVYTTTLKRAVSAKQDRGRRHLIRVRDRWCVSIASSQSRTS